MILFFVHFINLMTILLKGDLKVSQLIAVHTWFTFLAFERLLHILTDTRLVEIIMAFTLTLHQVAIIFTHLAQVPRTFTQRVLFFLLSTIFFKALTIYINVQHMYIVAWHSTLIFSSRATGTCICSWNNKKYIRYIKNTIWYI